MIFSKKTLNELKQQNENTFNKVYNEYYKLLYYIAYSKCKNKCDSEEVVQDTFINMMKKINEFDDYHKFKEWITTICRNLAINKVTRKQKLELVEETDLDLINNYEKNDYLDYLNILDDLEKDIIILKIVHNLKFKDIALILKISQNVATKTYYEALNKLKSNLKDVM